MSHEPNATERASLTSFMVGLLVVALMALVAILAFGARDDVVSTDDIGTAPSTTSPATSAPPTPEPDDPSAPVGADSPLVGLTEAQVRDTYVVVRVVERDGEPLMTTMDLVPGRINLVVQDDRVIGATTESCDDALPASESAAWFQQACDPSPGTDGPDVTGTLRSSASGGGGLLVLEVDDDSNDYFQGLAVEPGPDAMLRHADGAPLGPQELAAGDEVRIWTAGACRESSPVQCEIEAMVVLSSSTE